MKKTREEKNGTIAALFLFQYSLLIPLMRYISPAILVAFTGIILMIAAFFVNKNVVVNLKAAAVIVALLALMLFKVLIDETELVVILNFLLISIPPLIVFSYRFDAGSFMKTCKKLSYINFALLLFLPFIERRVSYMRYGYGMVLTVLFSYLMVFRTAEPLDPEAKNKKHRVKKIIDILIFAVSTVETIVYGSRGVLVVIVAFIAIDILLIYRNHRARNFLLILVGFIAAFNVERILNFAIKVIRRFGITSYALRKYQYQLAVGWEEASSGRIRLYQSAFETMRNNPVIGTTMTTYDDSTLYVHNLFLQVGRDMGVVMMLISVIFVIYCLCLLISKRIEIDNKTIIAVFFCVSVVRLLISSNVWERPEFWALLCIVLNYKTVFVRQKAADTVPGAAELKGGG